MWDVIPLLLLLLFGAALGVGLGIIGAVMRRGRRKPRANGPVVTPSPVNAYDHCCIFRRPGCWLAVKSSNSAAVQVALGLHNPRPCSWVEGMEKKLFIAPPVKGWILVLGSGLPDPSEDVDACFRFVVGMSRELGQVQFFSASRILHYHAWVKAERGRVVRAYAWAGRTLWQQGALTPAERALGLKCFDYAEPAERTSFSQPDPVSTNTDKVPLLAARWSLDPARIDERYLKKEQGIAGEPSWRYR